MLQISIQTEYSLFRIYTKHQFAIHSLNPALFLTIDHGTSFPIFTLLYEL